MPALSQQQCRPVTTDEFISKPQLATYLDELKLLWHLDKTGQSICREFKFKDYYETMAFINAAAWIFHRQDHHPDMQVSYNYCKITFTTHSIGSLSVNDFICAARLNEITLS
ncbi:MAG: 4a-hydroxytetrahydrobiopterin dehydratase [Gammaproteobacteria bacterium]|nr:4a-hydroxytetrahydrobiopterin dehydratase [Gammaproteobacteria bacterium]